MSASDPATKPCPSCAKPLRPDAANCWFCGTVFGIVRCVECGSPNRTGSAACQICGEPVPSTPLLVAASDAPPRAPRASEQDCPSCGGPVPLAAVKCKHCGTELDGPRQKGGPRWGEGKDYAPHRGGRLLALAVVSFLCFPVVLAPLAVVLAIGDLKAIRAERMDPDGMGLTIAALVIGALITAAAYTLIGIALFSGWF